MNRSAGEFHQIYKQRFGAIRDTDKPIRFLEVKRSKVKVLTEPNTVINLYFRGHFCHRRTLNSDGLHFVGSAVGGCEILDRMSRAVKGQVHGLIRYGEKPGAGAYASVFTVV